MIISFIACLLAFLAIGLASFFYSKGTSEDYLIAGKNVPPFLVALSAVATNNSGFMFIGMIGLTYKVGLHSIWLMIGWIIGDLLASLIALRPLQRVSRHRNIHSFGGLLAHWQKDDHHLLRYLVAAITLLFLTVYAAAQLKAGSKAASVILEWPAQTGIWLSALIVLCYSFAGGIRASIWTDVAQSFVMLFGMGLLMVFALSDLGGVSTALQQLQQVDIHYMNWFPEGSWLDLLLFVAGWFAGGVAILGQPHIVIRFMALDSEHSITRMRCYYYGWFTLFYAMTIMVGLLSRLLIADTGSFDAELALPQMALTLFPPILIGLLLAAMFAATMSTADSLILACSASLTRDLFQGRSHSLWAAKLATVLVLSSACIIALSDNQTVFSLVLDAWGMLGAAFVPLVISYALGVAVSQWLGIVSVLTGLATFIVWSLSPWASMTYAVLPGMAGGMLILLLLKGWQRVMARS